MTAASAPRSDRAGRAWPVVLAALALAGTAIALVARAGTGDQHLPEGGRTVFADRFDRPDGLITNAWAHWNEDEAGALVDPDWRVTSGSLYAEDGAGWTGPPDGGHPDAESSTATGSAVFRLRTQRTDLGDVRVDARIRIGRYVSTARTEPTAWDGPHLWLRYQSPQHLYAASIARRDGSMVVKKKCPGGTANGGTYFTLGEPRPSDVPSGVWTRVAASVQDIPDGGVRIRLATDGVVRLDVSDHGKGCGPIQAPGAIGVRADNVSLRVDSLVVRTIA